MTKQEIFDKVAAHLLTQRKRCVNQTGDCVYRSDDGLKCAAGCLIPDDVDIANKPFNVSPWSGIPLDIRTRILGDDADFNRKESMIISLQDIHDSPDSWVNWRVKFRLRNLAELENLDYSILAEYEDL
jgi:hypothetical protein